ncbi:hypothetical protein pb186bvf_020646 [Paramecium bursaria]
MNHKQDNYHQFFKVVELWQCLDDIKQQQWVQSQEDRCSTFYGGECLPQIERKKNYKMKYKFQFNIIIYIFHINQPYPVTFIQQSHLSCQPIQNRYYLKSIFPIIKRFQLFCQKPFSFVWNIEANVFVYHKTIDFTKGSCLNSKYCFQINAQSECFSCDFILQAIKLALPSPVCNRRQAILIMIIIMDNANVFLNLIQNLIILALVFIVEIKIAAYHIYKRCFRTLTNNQKYNFRQGCGYVDINSKQCLYQCICLEQIIMINVSNVQQESIQFYIRIKSSLSFDNLILLISAYRCQIIHSFIFIIFSSNCNLKMKQIRKSQGIDVQPSQYLEYSLSFIQFIFISPRQTHTNLVKILELFDKREEKNKEKKEFEQKLNCLTEANQKLEEEVAFLEEQKPKKKDSKQQNCIIYGLEPDIQISLLAPSKIRSGQDIIIRFHILMTKSYYLSCEVKSVRILIDQKYLQYKQVLVIMKCLNNAYNVEEYAQSIFNQILIIFVKFDDGFYVDVDDKICNPCHHSCSTYDQ